MAPKRKAGSLTKSQIKSKAARTTNGHGGDPINHSNNSNVSSIEQDVGGGTSQPNSQHILGRKNKLNVLLSNSQQATVNEGKSTSKSKSNPNPKLKPKPLSISRAKPAKKSVLPSKGTHHEEKKKPEFEEDEGFIYKRSQSIEADSEITSNRKKRKPISTPVLMLHEEADNLSRDADSSHDLHLLDLSNSKRSKANHMTESNTRRHNFLDESSLQLSSPIKDIRGNHDYSSDSYIEQVSHHTLTLDEPVVTGRNKGSRINHQNSINSNKRRSSYNNRGKRVSSIGNGFVGEPHQDVPVSDYYKLLDTSLPEPDRVRQLLVWCFKKKLEQEEKATITSKPSSTEDQTVINIAKVIKEEVLNDLIEKQISTSWYSKIDTDDYDIPGKEITIPNPLNIVNAQNIDIYAQKLKSLIKQKQLWEDAYNKTTKPIKNLPEVINRSVKKAQLEQYIINRNEDDSGSSVDVSVLDDSYLNGVVQNYEEVKSKLTDNLESSVDKLYHTTYQLAKVSEVVESMETTRLKTQVSSLLQDYMKRPETRRANIDPAKHNSFDIWPKPVKSVDTKSLLRSLTRLGNANTTSVTSSNPK